jgi:hypothetical protein
MTQDPRRANSPTNGRTSSRGRINFGGPNTNRGFTVPGANNNADEDNSRSTGSVGRQAASGGADTGARTTSPNKRQTKAVEFEDTTNIVDMYVHNYRSNIKSAKQRADAIPLLALILDLKSYCDAKISKGEYPEAIPKMIENALAALASGRKVNGEDADSHMATIIERLNDENITLDRMEKVIEQLVKKLKTLTVKMLGGYGRDGEAYTKTLRTKVTKYTGQEFASLLIGDITVASAKDYFYTGYEAKDPIALKRHLVELSEREDMNTEYRDLCKYLSSKVEGKITKSLATSISSCFLKPFSESVKVEGEDGKRVQFKIPKSKAFMADAAGYKWTTQTEKDKEKKFTLAGDYYIITIGEQQQMVGYFFKKVDKELSDADKVADSIISKLPVTGKVASE